ncbi:MAG: lysophospholipid acyltransferase family protein, partial [Sphingobacteriia bacterium]
WGDRIAHYANTVWGYYGMLIGLCWVTPIRHGRLPRGHTYIYMSDHRSYMDIPACHVAFFRFFRYIGKAELGKIPLFGLMYRRLHIMLDRSSPVARARSLQLAAQALKQGDSLFIFPEGTTRHPDPKTLLPFQEGAFALAIKTKTPIVPVAWIGNRKMLSGDGSFRMRPFVHIRAHIHPPIPTKDLDLSQVTALQEQVRGWIQHQITTHEN